MKVVSLTDLLRRKSVWYCGRKKAEAVKQVKRILSALQVLVFFDPAWGNEVQTDISSLGIAGMPIQKSGKEKKVVALHSRKTIALLTALTLVRSRGSGGVRLSKILPGLSVGKKVRGRNGLHHSVRRNPGECLSIQITDGEWTRAAEAQYYEIENMRKALELGYKRLEVKNYFDLYNLKWSVLFRRTEHERKWLVPKAAMWNVVKFCHVD